MINAAGFAPGAELLVSVRREDRGVRVEVINGPPAQDVGDDRGPGNGVPMRARRVAAIGGMLAVGRNGAGYAVRAWFAAAPRDA